MSTGKDICAQLKAVRKKVAEANDISYTPTPCTYTGECNGTCPVCDAELQSLTEAIREKEQAGKLVRVDGIAANLIHKLEGNETEKKQVLDSIKTSRRQLEFSKDKVERLSKLVSQLNEELKSDSTSGKRKSEIPSEIKILENILSNYK